MREKGAGAPRALQGDLEPSAAAAAPRRWGREWEAKEALEINSPPLCCRRLPPPRALPAFFRRSRVFRVRAAGPHLLRGTLALVHLSGGSPAQPSGSTAAAFQSVSPRPLCLVSAPRSIRPRGPSSSPRGTHGRGVVAAGGGRAAQREPGEAPAECLPRDGTHGAEREPAYQPEIRQDRVTAPRGWWLCAVYIPTGSLFSATCGPFECVRSSYFFFYQSSFICVCLSANSIER